MTYFLVWLYFFLCSLVSNAGWVAALAGIPVCVFTGVMFANFMDEGGTLEKYKAPALTRIYCWTVLFLLVAGSAIPSKGELATIVGIPALMEIAQNKEVTQLPENVLKLLNKELEEAVNTKEKADE